MKMKKVLAVLMSLCMVTGVVSYGAPVIAQTITAQADSVEGGCYSFNEATRVLTLKGNVDRDELMGFSDEFKRNIKSVVAENGTVFPEDSSGLFNFFSSCVSIDLSNADTSNVTNMGGMFAYCSSLKSLDLSCFDTSKVTNMNSMFERCFDMTSIDLSGFDTSNVKYMNGMFSGCTGLTNIDVSGFDTSNTTDMIHMFKDCSKLKTLDLSNFDTSNVKYMDSMFDNCSELKTITLGKNYKNIKSDAQLPNGEGWVNAKDTSTVISGDGNYAVIENSGKNTYKRLPIEAENPENALTYPTNIKVEYSKEYHQVRFTWDKVENADRYGVAVYLAGKWRVQKQDITGTVYTSPKNLTPGRSYRVAIAARVNGKWDTTNAIRHSGTVTIR